MSDWFDAGKDNAYYERKLREFGWVRGDETLGKLNQILRDFYIPPMIEQLNQDVFLFGTAFWEGRQAD